MICGTMAQINILFVCHGNTCRSPMAEALARHLAAKAGRSDLQFRSAGIAPRSTGTVADPRAVACIGKRGIDLSGHRVRALDAAADVKAFDLLLALDGEVFAVVKERVPASFAHKVRPLMSFAPGCGVSEVPDPYSGSAADYDYALGLIERAIEGILAAPAGALRDVGSPSDL